MADRIEEKYLIDYAEYARIAAKIRQLLVPDQNGKNGKYSICSLYFDDAYNTALYDKIDGNAVHTKFRVRTYDNDDRFIRLERKTKRGVITEKHSARITLEELDKIIKGENIDENAQCFGLASEMRAKAVKPKVAVRYDREAYVMPALGVRVTFDTNVESLCGDKQSLFQPQKSPIPAIPRGMVIMEIKYTDKCPSFIRKCCANSGMQMSVSKYALCRGETI